MDKLRRAKSNRISAFPPFLACTCYLTISYTMASSRKTRPLEAGIPSATGEESIEVTPLLSDLTRTSYTQTRRN